MYTLYARKGAGSFVVEALLAELGQKYRLIEANPAADGTPHAGLLRRNPLGQVPTLVLPDGVVMTESVAMVIHLTDRHGAARLAPGVKSPQRAAYLRWLVFLAANLYPSYLRFYYPDRYSSAGDGAAGVRAAAVAALRREWDIVAKALGRGPWMLGSRYSALDLFIAMLATWEEDRAAFARRHPALGALTTAVKARRKVAPVWASNNMP